MMMMMGKEDLGLSLSLGFSQNHHPLHLNLIKPSSSSSSLSNLHMYPWNHHTFISSSDEQKQQFLRKIDVKSLARSVECEDERGVSSSPNSRISSSVSGKRSEREGDHETLDRSSSRGGGTSNSEEEEGGDTDTCRKKLRLSKHQSALLEDTFKDHNTLNPKQKLALAKKLSLTARQVEVWFQNRRARTKLKQTEVDCEYLKRCVEKLTEENRRLQKEAAELRTLKFSPQFFNANQMSPPTTLLMCPSCERHPPPSSLKTTNSIYNHNHNHNHNHSHKQRSLSSNPWLHMGNGPMLEAKPPPS